MRRPPLATATQKDPDVTTALITHPACLEHDTGPYHPETSERLRAVLQALEAPEFSDLLREQAPKIGRASCRERV